MAKKPKVESLPVNEIEARAENQPRARLDPHAIDDYADEMKQGTAFPPVDVFVEKGSSRYVLAHGFHRLAAAKRAGAESIECVIHDGDVHDARRFALGVNFDNGVRRTNADKVKAVKMMLDDPQFDKLSFRDMAKICHVSHEFIRQAKKQREEESSEEQFELEQKKTTDAASNTRIPPKRPEPHEVERRDLVNALDQVRSFPYSGKEAADRMKLEPFDYDKVNFVACWLGDLAEALEKKYGKE